MASKPFRTYLETFRMRSGFSRPEIGFLLGVMDGKNVSRHERWSSIPKLHTALAYAVIFDIPVDQLFEGLAIEIREEMKSRARGLATKLSKGRPTRIVRKKVAILRRIAGDSVQTTG